MSIADFASSFIPSFSKKEIIISVLGFFVCLSVLFIAYGYDNVLKKRKKSNVFFKISISVSGAQFSYASF